MLNQAIEIAQKEAACSVHAVCSGQNTQKCEVLYVHRGSGSDSRAHYYGMGGPATGSGVWKQCGDGAGVFRTAITTTVLRTGVTVFIDGKYKEKIKTIVEQEVRAKQHKRLYGCI